MFVFPSRHSRNPQFTEAAPQLFILLNQVKRRKGEPESDRKEERRKKTPGEGALVGERDCETERERGGEVSNQEREQAGPTQQRKRKQRGEAGNWEWGRLSLLMKMHISKRAGI